MVVTTAETAERNSSIPVHRQETWQAVRSRIYGFSSHLGAFAGGEQNALGAVSELGCRGCFGMEEPKQLTATKTLRRIADLSRAALIIMSLPHGTRSSTSS
jgi:hypothetical protein